MRLVNTYWTNQNSENRIKVDSNEVPTKMSNESFIVSNAFREIVVLQKKSFKEKGYKTKL